MPTGYTAELMDKGQDFRSFVLTCARAFGACIMQRDDPLNEPPKKTEPSDFYAKRLREAESKLHAMRAMPEQERRLHGEMLRDKAIKSARDSYVKYRAENERLAAMEESVRAWTPPTPEHLNLKDFMLEQIRISKHDLAWTLKWLREAEERSASDYFVSALRDAECDIPRYTEEKRKEEESANGRNEWIEQLYASLPAQSMSPETGS